MKVRILLILTLLFCLWAESDAQSLSVKKMEYAVNDLSARTQKRLDKNGDECALVKLRLVLSGAKFEGQVIEVKEQTSEYWIYMAQGSKKLTIIVSGYLPLEVVFEDYEINRLEKLNTYILTVEIAGQKKNYVNSEGFYVQGFYQVGSLMGAGASVGGYFKNINLEGSIALGLSESEEIAWKSTKSSSDYGYSYTYKPMFFGLKFGYGIRCGNTFRITPQVGIGVSSIKGTEVKKGLGTDPDATSCYAVPASIGARMEYYISNHFGLCASPEFGFAVMSSDTYSKLSDLSSKVKGYGSGFNARLGIFVCF